MPHAMLRAFLAVLLAVLASSARAQTSPFLPDATFRHLVNEISGDRAFEGVRRLTHYHRTAGSADFFAAAEEIRRMAEAAGLEDVKLVRQKWNGHGWSASFGEAWLLSPEEKIAAYADVGLSIADHSRTTHVTAELLDVGAGTSERDYDGREVKGRIVLAHGPVAAAHREAVWKRGALGVLSHATSRPDAVDAPDQLAWGRLAHDARGVEGVADGTPSTFAVMISPRRGRALQARLQAGEKLTLRVDIEASYPARQEQAYVEGWIRGSEVDNQQVVLTAHIQEEQTSANDDASGCASLVEIGRALTRLMKEGKVARPRRDIRFWWVNEFASQEQFFREDAPAARRMLVNLNQDMVGARQSLGGRVQYASRLPWSNPHALDDVMESVLTMVRDGNTTLLTHRGTRTAQPFPREILAVKGSREPFHARMVPYFNYTDHHAFNPALIGVPGTSLTNWPDEYIHSTGDDLEQVDATQIERNAVVVAGVALAFAGLDDESAAALAAYVAARGAARIAADLAAAVAHLAEAAPSGRPAALRAARNLVRHSRAKEAAALASVARMAPGGRAAALVDAETSRLESGLAADRAALDRAYAAMAGQAAADVPLSADERALQGLVYLPVTDVGVWQDAMDRLRPEDGLHPMMRFEVYNFADGRRDALEVYERVAAEALSAGLWYYGEVKARAVREALDAGVAAGAFALPGR